VFKCSCEVYLRKCEIERKRKCEIERKWKK
jgi:hypothetical protein